MTEGAAARSVLLIGSGAHAEAIGRRLVASGYLLDAHVPDVSGEELASRYGDDGAPYGLVIVVEEAVVAPPSWGPEWIELVASRLRSAFAQARALARPMMRARGGRVVFVVSAGGLRGDDGNDAATVISAALTGMARSAARELAGRSVTVNTVAYAGSDTADTPLSRAVEPDEVAGACVYLLSDDAAAVCGQVLTVDGGWVMR